MALALLLLFEGNARCTRVTSHVFPWRRTRARLAYSRVLIVEMNVSHIHGGFLAECMPQKKEVSLYEERRSYYDCVRSTISAIGALFFIDSIPFLQPSFDS